MLSESKRQEIVDKGMSRKGKNQYTQGPNRNKVDSGYSDCSAFVRWCYKQVLGIDIGVNTEAQINSKNLETINVPITNGIPDESYLKKADLLYFRGNDTSRTKGVGHVEMYIGNGKLLGHGGGIGPTEKNIVSYCTYMQKTKSNNGNRGLICVRRVVGDNETTSTSSKTNNSLSSSVSNCYIVKAGDTLSKIAIKFNTTVDNLVKLNNIADKNKIKVGQEIYYNSDYSILLSGYKGTSIIDAFKFKKLDSSFANRKKYAEAVGIKNYKGTKEQNIQLLKLLGAN